jgi:hypothetical protein
MAGHGFARLTTEKARGSGAGRGARRETVLPVERKVRREGEGGDMETRLEGCRDASALRATRCTLCSGPASTTLRHLSDSSRSIETVRGAMCDADWESAVENTRMFLSNGVTYSNWQTRLETLHAILR